MTWSVRLVASFVKEGGAFEEGALIMRGESYCGSGRWKGSSEEVVLHKEIEQFPRTLHVGLQKSTRMVTTKRASYIGRKGGVASWKSSTLLSAKPQGREHEDLRARLRMEEIGKNWGGLWGGKEHERTEKVGRFQQLRDQAVKMARLTGQRMMLMVARNWERLILTKFRNWGTHRQDKIMSS